MLSATRTATHKALLLSVPPACGLSEATLQLLFLTARSRQPARFDGWVYSEGGERARTLEKRPWFMMQARSWRSTGGRVSMMAVLWQAARH